MAISEWAGKESTASVPRECRDQVRCTTSVILIPGVPAERVVFGHVGHRGTSTIRQRRSHSGYGSGRQRVPARCVFTGLRWSPGQGYHAPSSPLCTRRSRYLRPMVCRHHGRLLRQGRSAWRALLLHADAAISHAILTHNRGPFRAKPMVRCDHARQSAPGCGFKYNPPEGGPAGSETTRRIQERANEILTNGLKRVRRIPFWQGIGSRDDLCSMRPLSAVLSPILCTRSIWRRISAGIEDWG